MKAVVLRAPGDVGVDDVADPAILEPGDAIVAVGRPRSAAPTSSRSTA